VAIEGRSNKYLIGCSAFITNLCIGSPYGWSFMGNKLTSELGFLGSSANDWTLLETTMPFSLTLAFHGISASLVGKYQMKIGARASVGLSSLLFGGGLIVGSLGI